MTPLHTLAPAAIRNTTMPAHIRSSPASRLHLAFAGCAISTCSGPAAAQVAAVPLQPAAGRPAVLQSVPAQPSTAAQPGAVITPPPGAVGAVGQHAGGPALPPEELADLKAMFDALSPDEKLEMKAAYAGMGLDLDLLLSLIH